MYAIIFVQPQVEYSTVHKLAATTKTNEKYLHGNQSCLIEKCSYNNIIGLTQILRCFL
jgi:hypothetical protein